MSILIDKLPNSVVIDGMEYAINSDFRTSIQFEILMCRNDIDKAEKLSNGLILYYPIIPANILEAIEKIMWFYSCGKDNNVTNNNGNDENANNSKIYDYNYDDDYIFSAFISQYRIDLNSIDYLHWWKFKAMFKALNEDNKIVKIMEYRSMDISKISDKSQREFYKKMKKIYEIPMPKEERQKLDEINNILLNGGDISKIL